MMGLLKFDGASGLKPQTQARRYVYRIMVTMLENELESNERDGWMFGGIEQEPDVRRLTKAIKEVAAEMFRKAGP